MESADDNLSDAEPLEWTAVIQIMHHSRGTETSRPTLQAVLESRIHDEVRLLSIRKDKDRQQNSQCRHEKGDPKGSKSDTAFSTSKMIHLLYNNMLVPQVILSSIHAKSDDSKELRHTVLL